jgi:hypothetical protein
VVVQHQAVEVAKAVVAVKDAKDQLKQAEQDYRQYQKELNTLETQLATLESDYANDSSGVDYNDLQDMQVLVTDLKDDDIWYQSAIVLATTHVASKVTAVAQQGAAAAQSTATYGFNAGLQLDVSADKTHTQEQTTQALASTIQGHDITIVTGGADTPGQTGSTLIQGSNLLANNNLNITTGTLDVRASVDSAELQVGSENASFSVSQTVWGAAGGPTVNASYGQSQSEDSSTSHNNSVLNANNNINITTTGDTSIVGGNVDAANDLNVAVGGDLTLESVQDRQSGSNKSFGISGGLGFSGDNSQNTGKTASTSFNNVGDVNGVNSANGGVNASSGRYQDKETLLSTLTGGNNANITVAGNTDIKGALIATLDENGNDLGNLNLTTDTLSYTDLSNRSFATQQGIGISANVGLNETVNPNDPNQNSTDMSLNGPNVNLDTSTQASGGSTLATIGEGNLVVGNTTDSDNLDNLNRDITQIETELYNTDTGTSVDASIDLRLFSEEGRGEIKNDIVDSYEFGQDIVSASETLNESDALGLLDFFGALHNNAMGTQLKNDLLRNPDNAHILEGLKSGDGDEYALSMQALGTLAQDKFGLDVADITLYDADATTSNNLQDTLFVDVKGGLVRDESNENHGDIFIDATDGANKTDMINTLGHETLEVLTLQQGGDNGVAQEALSDAFGEQLANRVNQAAGGELDSSGGSQFNQSLQNSQAVTTGTERANTVGNANVDNKAITLNQAQILDNVRGVITRHNTLSDKDKQLAQAQLNALACAAVKCAEHIPEGDDYYDIFKTLQAQGEALNDDGMTLGGLIGEEHAGEFEHGLVDVFNDKLLKYDETLTRVGGAAQAVGGALGVFGGYTVAAGGAVACVPSAGLSCAAIPVGAAISAVSYTELESGTKRLVGDYEQTIGAASEDAFSVDTHQGDTNPAVDLAIGAGILAIEGVTAKIGGKYLETALDNFIDAKVAVKVDGPGGSGGADSNLTPNPGTRPGATDDEIVGQSHRFDPKGFSNERQLDASDVNLSHSNNLGTDYIPYKNGTVTTERHLQPGEKFYSVEYPGQSAPGGWATPKRYTSIEQARKELALLPEFKDSSGGLVIREYTVKKPTPIREGTVGGLKSENGSTYEGGGSQIEFLFDRGSKKNPTWKEYLFEPKTYELGN